MVHLIKRDKEQQWVIRLVEHGIHELQMRGFWSAFPLFVGE